MKKLLTTLAMAITFASVASADFARIEMGAGAWMQTPSGDVTYTSTLSGFADASKESSQTQGYAWLLVKHPIPVIPNIRLEYVNALNEGTYVTTTPIGSLSSGISTELEMTQIDVIPYYNILDNTAWITLDLGLDLKLIDIAYSAGGVDIIDALNVDIASVVMPLGYVRARVQAPATNIGFEADIKYITFDSNTVSDIRVKVDYTLDMIPVIQPAIEIGYRMQKFDLEESNFKVDTEFSGVYAGVMLRF